MDYTWENLTSREFEIIACNLAEDIFPAYEWKLTGKTRDDNHDFFAESGIGDKWGEAKHSKNAKKDISRSQWDPTIVSAKLKNSVNDILLVTCAYIPLPYIIRAFHMISAPIDNIYCINRYLLNEWYQQKKTPYSVFDSDLSLKEILYKINVCATNTTYNDDIQMYIFNSIEKNYLTIVENLISNCEYNINIAIFSNKDNVKVKINLGKYISFIKEIRVINMSSNNKSNIFPSNDKQFFECDIFKGYSIILFDIITSNEIVTNQPTYISYSLDKIEKKEQICISNTEKIDDKLLLDFEKEFKNTYNRIIKTNYIPPHLLKRPNYKLFYIHFDCRNNNNFTQLCRLLAFFFTGIDFQELDEKIVKQTLFLGNYTDWLENVILGVFSDAISRNSILYKLPDINDRINYISNKVIYIIENVSFLKEDEKKVIHYFEELISKKYNDSILIFQNKEKSKSDIKINDEIALVAIFETGVVSDLLKTKYIQPNNNLIRLDIDKKLYYPSNNIQFNDVVSFFINKSEEQKKEFLNRLIKIASNQMWSSRVFDFILLIDGKIFNNIYFETIRFLRDIHYNRTDFYSAYNYSLLLHKDENQQIDDMYKEADELNHCGSIIESKKLFEKVAKKALEMKDTKYTQKGVEALTEVYNIRFWLLDVNNLENEIDDTIDTYFTNDKILNIKGRELYPYYNCLNRKMVVQYLLNQYTDAENTFQTIITKVVLDNYKAFAYMDSARGLYNIDIALAYNRITKAYAYLKELFSKGKEIRRYHDCLIEKAYIEFIMADYKNRCLNVKHLKNAIYEAKKYGFKSIVEKSYFKLTACYLVLGYKEEAKNYLDKIVNSLYFKDSPRNQLIYNELMKGYYHLNIVKLADTLHISSNFCQASSNIDFKCFDNGKGNIFYIDGCMW